LFRFGHQRRGGWAVRHGQHGARLGGLHVVPNLQINSSTLNAATAIAINDISAVGLIGGTSDTTLAEYFNGTSWSVVPTHSDGVFVAGVAAVASNDVWPVGGQGS